MSPTFAQLGVPDWICRKLDARGITEPFEIQQATIADALAGRDVCGRAPTGSGKTLAFGIPLVASVEEANSKRPRALVLAPTRELAEQIATELKSFSGSVRVAVVYGGVGYDRQIRALNKGAEILVACPGRLEDLINQGLVALNEVDKVVVDEADRMADMGFLPAVRRLLDQTSPRRQTLLFSATLDGDIAKLTRDYQHEPVRHEVGSATPDITMANHVFWNVTKAERVATTAAAVDAAWPAIIFCRTRHGSDRVAKQLARSGVAAAAIHGGRSQNQRTRALSDFTNGKVQALVATDVAARGIHVDGVASVIHFDPPEDHKAYLHRSGRTARAGESGVVLSLIQPEQARDLVKMQRKLHIDGPITDPDPEGLIDLAPAKPTHKPALPAATQSKPANSGKGSGKPRNRGGSNGRGKGHKNGQGKSKSHAKNGSHKNGQAKSSGQPKSNGHRNRSNKQRTSAV
jgi:superfamily II DNA/RNA helicase